MSEGAGEQGGIEEPSRGGGQHTPIRDKNGIHVIWMDHGWGRVVRLGAILAWLRPPPHSISCAYCFLSGSIGSVLGGTNGPSRPSVSAFRGPPPHNTIAIPHIPKSCRPCQGADGSPDVKRPPHNQLFCCHPSEEDRPRCKPACKGWQAAE